jgi:hypothetical protein
MKAEVVEAVVEEGGASGAASPRALFLRRRGVGTAAFVNEVFERE